MRLAKVAVVVLLGMLVSSPAFATFHLMQIEQVIAGVNGDPSVQAIQLRMRASFENQIQNARLRVFDAAGGSAVTLIDFASPAPIQGAGRRILIATANFQTTPAITPDFILTTPIPASYLAAGSLIYEQDPPGPVVLWRLSWGGAGYTGLGTGTTDNDANGQFSPAYAGPLPSSSTQALLFQFAASALSTTNAADYAVTPAAAVFTNNAGQSGTVIGAVPVESNTWGRIKSQYR